MAMTIAQLMEPLGPGRPSLPEGSATVAADRTVESLLGDPALEAGTAHGLRVRDGEAVVGWVSPARVTRAVVDLSRRLAEERDEACRTLSQVRSERALLVANLGHELRTPLNAIVGYSDLIRSKALGAISPPLYGDYIDAIHLSSLHLVSLLDALLDLIKIQASEKQLSEELVDLRQVVAFSLQVVASLARQRDVRLDCRIRDGLPFVRGDERMLRQILLNLLSNAIKFTRPGTSVTVSAWANRRGEMRVEVRDNGPGIPPEQLPVVMQPFKQIAEYTDQGRRGTGLGLPIVKALTELHDGQFRLLSRMEEGTRAIVILPASRVVNARHEDDAGGFSLAEPIAAQVV